MDPQKNTSLVPKHFGLLVSSHLSLEAWTLPTLAVSEYILLSLHQLQSTARILIRPSASPFFSRRGIDISNRIKKTSNTLTVIKAIILFSIPAPCSECDVSCYQITNIIIMRTMPITCAITNFDKIVSNVYCLQSDEHVCPSAQGCSNCVVI